jgi:hypothetical protein
VAVAKEFSIKTAGIDEGIRRRALEIAAEMAALRKAKVDAVAAQDFACASELRSTELARESALLALDIPAWVRREVLRSAGLWDGNASRFVVLGMLAEAAIGGEPDPRVLAALPRPIVPPVRLAIPTQVESPASTAIAMLPSTDADFPYYDVVAVISPETLARTHQGYLDTVRVAFDEISWSQETMYGSVLLCISEPISLGEEVCEALLAGVNRTNCDFVLFEEDRARLKAIQGRLQAELIEL